MPPGPIVVTGGAGFIGSNLCARLLAEGWAVRAIDDLSQGVREQVPDGAEFVELDVLSPDLARHLTGAAAIFHLAAKNCIADCQLDPLATALNNVAGTVSVLEAACRAGVQRIVYAETSALYEGVARWPTAEDEVAPQSMYAVSKLASRHFVDAYVRYHGVQCTALRYFCVYGPRQDYRRTIPPVICAFILRLLRGERPTIYGTGEQRRDFVYVDDVNDFHMLCLHDRRTIGGTYNLGSGVDHSVREMLAMIQQQLGTAVAPAYEAELPAEAERTCADITRARALGWAPRIGVEEGLRRTIAYLRAHVAAQPAVAGM